MNKKSAPSEQPISRSEQQAATALENFVCYLSNPWRLMWVNFLAGIFRGLGAVVGASIVIAGIIWLASLFVNMPLVGKYAEQLEQAVQNYVNETNYNAELDRMGDSLERIEEALGNANVVIPPDSGKVAPKPNN